MFLVLGSIKDRHGLKRMPLLTTKLCNNIWLAIKWRTKSRPCHQHDRSRATRWTNFPGCLHYGLLHTD
jgi:hypothetical protein